MSVDSGDARQYLSDPFYTKTKRRDTRWLFLCPTTLLTVLMVFWAIDPSLLVVSLSSSNDGSTALPAPIECLQEVHFMIIALCAGGLGAYLRVITGLPPSLDEFFERGNDLLSQRLLVTAGMVIGVAVYWLISSKAFVQIAYSKAPDLGATTRTGVAIVAILAGLLTKELIGRVTSSFKPTRAQSASDQASTSPAQTAQAAVPVVDPVTAPPATKN